MYVIFVFWSSDPLAHSGSVGPYYVGVVFFRVELPRKPKKSFEKKISIIPPHKHHLSMDHISGNKIRIGSIEVPFDREYPDQVTVKVG
jgi:hypothetical protein